MKAQAKYDIDAAKRFFIVRNKLGFNQQAMASICGVTQGAIAKIEAAVLDIPQKALKNLYIVHNISPLYIIAGVQPWAFDTPKPKPPVNDLLEMEADIEILKANLEALTKDVQQLKNRP